MANASKNKGKAYERDVAKRLTEIFEANFERVPSSGAFTGGKNAHRKDKLTDTQILLSDGDLIVPDSLKHTRFECKCYKEFSFNRLFTSNSIFESWVDQIRSDEYIWFVTFKINRQGEYVAFDKKYLDHLKDISHYMVYNDVIITSFDPFFNDNRDIIERFNAEMCEA